MTSIAGVGDVLGEVWTAATTPQPPPPGGVLLGAALVGLALVVVPVLWRVARNAVTVVHEGAHALVAVLTGRRLAGIRLHTDTSGLTVSVGRPRGPGMVATAAAGYLGPAAVGVLAAWLLGRGYAVGMLWALLVAVVLLVLQVRNLYGLWVLLVGGAGLLGLTWWASSPVQQAAAYTITWFLLLGAVRAVVELQALRRRGRARNSDADMLARLTAIPGIVWVGVFLAAAIGALVVGSAWILPAP